MSWHSINTTNGKEFAVEAELKAMGLHPWVPRALCSKSIKEKSDPVWYDRPYVPKLLFCVIPAVYWPDVTGLKEVIGKPVSFGQRDIDGQPEYTVRGTSRVVPARPGLSQFRQAVEAEYAAMERLRENSEWVCAYKPGQALEILEGAFQGFPGKFQGIARDARRGHPMIQVAVEIFGRETIVEAPPAQVGIA